MDNYEFFDRYQVWITINFFPDSFVADLREIANRNPYQQTKVADLEEGKPGIIDEQKRKSSLVVLPQIMKEEIRKRMVEFIPFLNFRFAVRLSAYEGPQLLVYRSGDFFKVHRDRAKRKDHLPDQRQVSTTLFLNKGGTNRAEDEYYGGQLALLCREMNDSSYRWIELRGVPGTLVAFRSDVPHEVRPVKSGERITIVGWFK